MNDEWQSTPPPQEELPDSKTQRKKQMTAVQKLGEELIALNNKQLETFELDPALKTAITEYKRLPNRHEAKRRQLQFIGKLMRKSDHEAIATQLEKLRTPDLQEVRRGQSIGEWITRLEAGQEEDITAFIDRYPGAERQPLRQLVRNSRNNNAAEPHRQRLLDFIKDHIPQR